MSPGKASYNLAIVGAGRQGMAILEALVPARRDDQPLRVVGVADLNPEAPGILYAFRHNLFVTVNFADLLQLPELDILVNATGRPEVTQELQAHCPAGVCSPKDANIRKARASGARNTHISSVPDPTIAACNSQNCAGLNTS